jgi:DNA repair ATPase RecN
LNAKTPLERVQESEKLLERIMLIVPGFRGYKLREQRREADRIVRDYIYRALEQSRDNLTSCLQALSDSKALELMEPMNRLLAKLDRIAEKINHASYGYSGFFDSIKIEEVELDKMLSYDTQLMDLVRKFSATTASFKSDLTQNKLENARTAQKDLEASVANLESTFDERKSVIEGVKV